MQAKRKSYLTGQKLYAYLQNTRTAFYRMHVNARRFAWSQEFLLAEKSKLLDCENWRRLTGLDQSRLFGYWEALADSLIAELQFRYLINGQWYLPSEVCDRKDGTEPSKDCKHDNAHYVHLVNTHTGPEYRIYF